VEMEKWRWKSGDGKVATEKCAGSYAERGFKSAKRAEKAEAMATLIEFRVCDLECSL
jgi:hypothetical protein